MQVYIIVPSINPLKNLENLAVSSEFETKILVIDEGEKQTRKVNHRILSNFSHKFYGPKEREQWFKDRLGQNFDKYLGLIPEKCHAETSFGFLVAYANGATVILEVDDDVYTSEGFLNEHINVLFNSKGVTVNSSQKWYNTLENLHLNTDQKIFPRGHPYSPPCRNEEYTFIDNGRECVLNMGLWSGQPDLDALTLLYHGGLDGRCKIESKGCKKEKIVIGNGTYLAVCSMNTLFLSKIVPAYYQLYMNFMDIDRFDDIWSGVFLKRIADHIGDKICLGKPLGLHLKRPRNIFKDLRKETNGLYMNEVIWKMAEEAELSSKNYADCYLELSSYLENSASKWFEDNMQIKFWRFQAEYMRKWVELIDKIS